MKVSVCMITYNHERFIAQAIESVLMQQTDFQYELVIGEDCSIDGTRAIVTDYARRFPDRIRPLLRDKNLGVSDNFIDTLGACTGEYIALLEGDDYWTSPQKLQRQIAQLDHATDASLAYHPVLVVREDGAEPAHTHPSLPHHPVSTLSALLRANGLAIQTCSVMFRRRAIGSLPNWIRNVRCGDFPLFVLCAERGRIVYCPEVMAVYRIQESGIWSSATTIQRLTRAIEQEEALRAHLGPAYRRRMNGRLATIHAHLAIANADAQQAQIARGHVRDCLELVSHSGQANWRTVARMFVKVYTPRLYVALRSWNRHRTGRAR